MRFSIANESEDVLDALPEADRVRGSMDRAERQDKHLGRGNIVDLGQFWSEGKEVSE